ncbi:MAG: hypothetical protein ACJ785_09300 [Gemmatimonadaceae bacterium]
MSNRGGYVLVAALLAMVLIGALAVAAVFATTEDTKVGTAGMARDRALNAAESAISIVMSQRPAVLPASIGVAGTTSNSVGGLDVPTIVYITRLDSSVYWIVAEAALAPSQSGARRRIGVLVKAVWVSNDSSIVIDPILQRPWSELF